MKLGIITAFATLSLINVAVAAELVHLHCVPKATEIRVIILPSSEVAPGDWRQERNTIGTAWRFVARSRSGSNLVGDIMSAKGHVAGGNVAVPASEWTCGTEAEWQAGKLLPPE